MSNKNKQSIALGTWFRFSASLNNLVMVTAMIAGVYGFTALQAAPNNDLDDSKLIEEFIQAKENAKSIIFDGSNIKQFWVSKQVLSKNNRVQISLEKGKDSSWESVALPVQLSNVIETQKCTIEVITENQDLSYSILDNKSKAIAKSSNENQFIQNFIAMTEFNLEDIPGFAFNIQFKSNTLDTVSIKKIILSFSENKDTKYAGSPGFDKLEAMIKEQGTEVPDTEVKYLISEKYRKLFVLYPEPTGSGIWYYYHVWPTDKENLVDRERINYNNFNNSINKQSSFIPKPFGCNSKYAILQVEIPPYNCYMFRVGLNVSGKHIWRVELKNLTYNPNNGNNQKK